MKRFKSVDQIWEALDAGAVVYWENEGYQVLAERDPVPEEHLFSERNGMMLRATYMENWFGSRLYPSDIRKCFTKEG